MTDWEIYEQHCKGEFQSIRNNQESAHNRIDERFDHLEERMDIFIEKMDEFINGNGRMGAKEMFAAHRRDIDSLKTNMKWLAGVGTAVITGVLIRYAWVLFEQIYGQS